jgi:diguanylate cyclase (GGDEF)-like protein
MIDDGISPSTLVLLRGVELFSSLLDDDLAYVASRCERLVFSSGDELLAQGGMAERLYVIESGGAAIYRLDGGGNEKEVARYIEGDAIGDFEFAIQTRYSGSARADSPTVAFAFPARGFTMGDLVREKPDSASRILLRAASMVSARLRSTQALISRNSPWVRELRKQIYTDPGTGLWSSAFLSEEIPRFLEKPTSIVLVKPDRFKELNDAHGHSAGDAAMERFAAILNDQVERLGRGYALRLRSNETALVVPRCGPGEAAEIARFVSALAGAIDLSRSVQGCSFSFTASFAIATWPEDGEDWRRLFDEAGAILTRAWRDGGGRIYRLRSRRQEGGA